MPEPITLLIILMVFLIIGAFAGVLAGLLGVGGGIVLVPAFFYTLRALGYHNEQVIQICLATSLATIIFTSIRSLMAHHAKGAVDWDVLRAWAPGIMIGAVIGMALASGLNSDNLVAVFGVLGILIATYMGFGRADWRLHDEMPSGILRALLALLIGFLSVLMGIGGGSFGVPLMSLHGRPIHRAVATAAGFGVIIALPAVVGFILLSPPAAYRPPFMLGYINLPAFFIVIAMTMITAPYGAALAHRLEVKTLRRIFALFLAIVALNMLCNTVL